MPKLKRFQLMAGGHVGPDYTADPVEVSSPTNVDPDRVVLEYPPKMFKVRVSGIPAVPGDSNVVLSPVDLSEKHNRPNSTKFVALGDAPADIQAKFDEAVKQGLSARHSGVPVVGKHRLSLLSKSPTAGKSTGQIQDQARKDQGDVSPEVSEEDLSELSKDDLRDCAEKEGAEVNSRMTKDELVEAIKANRRK